MTVAEREGRPLHDGALSMERKTSSLALTALELLPAGVVVVDGAGVIRYANRHAESLHGVASGALVGRPIEMILASVEALRHGCVDGEARGELTLPTADLKTRTLGYSLSAWREGSDERIAVLYESLDRLQEVRTQRDRLLQLAVVGEVLPSLLHELRNPLAAVTTMVEVLVEEAPDGLQQDLHAVLWELRRIGLGLQGIGGLNHRVYSETAEAIDLAVEEACRVLGSSAEAAGVRLRTEVEPMPLLALERAAIKGVVFNLVRNAIDACRAGDEVVVSAHERDGVFELSVRDSGRGMTPEELARCTELFFTSKPNGSGIGLAICRRVAERGHGSLTIESQPGVGTNVVVRIPLVSPGDPSCRELIT